MLYVELVAATFGAISVVLFILRNHWSWPVGLIQVVLYIGVFANAKLYADMILHVIYAGLQFYGWWAWMHSSGGDDRTVALHGQTKPTERLVVRKLGLSGHLVCMIAAIAMTLTYAYLLQRFTDASMPLPDSVIAAVSLVAQTLLAWRYLDNWRYWIFVDIVAVVLFAYKELYITSILYALFLVMAVIGYRTWQNAYRIELRLEFRGL